jgi:glutamate synthase (NADPH/NADH) large chain
MQEVLKQGLYDPKNEHDACGVGFVVNIKGRKSHDIIAARWAPIRWWATAPAS